MTDRRQYQKEYYAKRKSTNLAILPLPETAPIKGYITPRKTLIYIFIIISTLFLIMENRAFYEAAEGGEIAAWIKSILMEAGIVVCIAAKLPKPILWVSLLLSAYTFTISPYKRYMDSKYQVMKHTAQIAVIESSIKDTTKLVSYYTQKDWPTTVNKLNKTNYELNLQLNQVLNSLNTSKTNTLADILALTMFRILMQIINAYLIKMQI